MDFGLSSVEDFTDPVVRLFGSIDYVSPEALSRSKITHKSDTWSLLILRHPWVTGDLAKQDQMDAEIVSRLQSFNARSSYDLKPEELEKLSIHFKKICKNGNNVLKAMVPLESSPTFLRPV
ncbi:unnamed protein product [Fraxinus pennsylvanica]|uniref:Protein kinase domain-containing protein n=1 Tax=Fraxinus pennsylvanica TaxID=56036 RepID=A0AAD1ZIG3_9LAMI|nr:unnamed protein product [Fraxinus pennsylvanica]